MNAAIVIDTETTDTDDPQVIELAYMGPLASPLEAGTTQLLNFRPTKPIALGALATHHIIASDLTDYPEWPGTWALPADCDGVGYIVGHNCDFDWKAIGSPDLKRICTLALSRSVWPSIDSHRLAALIYHLYPHGMARELVCGAHNAAADVSLCHRVLGALWDAVGRPESWEKFWQISEKARVPTRMSFGKFGPQNGEPGTLISEMRRRDPSYVQWLLSGKCDQVNNDPYLRKALTQ